MERQAPELVGQSPAWLATLEHVSRAALIDRPILLIGERGTGKELIAERLHFLSHRWDKPFVKVNCAALSQELLDSELFGHEQGSFTGANRRRTGRFEQADGGTLFLDEIATATLAVQEKLLRVIEYGEFSRLGGDDMLRCDVRVVAATNVDLPARAREGKFRADLLDRLAFDVVTVAPLRARPDDVELLAEYFASRLARELEADFPGWSPDALLVLRDHDWPGNVRELKNVAERAAFRAMADMAEGVSSGPAHLTREQIDPFSSPWRPAAELTANPNAKPQAVAGAQAPTATGQEAGPDSRQDTQPGAWPHAGAPDAGVPDVAKTFEEQVTAFEKALIERALDRHDGHQGKTADELGLSYHQLRGLLRKYGFTRANGAAQETNQKGAED
ncbi:MAG: phage shock protein operon transcriptional activator [Hyphomonadaceae bacterium]